jgi:hypothetical protein
MFRAALCSSSGSQIVLIQHLVLSVSVKLLLSAQVQRGLSVPCVTRCSNTWLVFLIHPNNMNLIHRGRASVSVSVKCLVLVKIYGNNPTKLFVKITRNGDVRINEFPLFPFPFLRIFLFLY